MKIIRLAILFVLLYSNSLYAQESDLAIPIQYESPTVFDTSITSLDKITHVTFSPFSETFYFSARESSSPLNERHVWYSHLNSNKKWSKVEKDVNVINLNEVNQVVGISKNEDRIYYVERNAEGFVESLYYRTRLGNNWDAPTSVELPSTDKKEVINDIYIHSGEDVMILTMTNKKLRSGKDLFISTRPKGGEWEQPQNLSIEINSEQDDYSPFLSEDKQTLFFSSRGHYGLGGSDIFKSERISQKWNHWSPPENLGNIINSEKDDAGFTMNLNYEILFVRGHDESGGVLMSSKIKNTKYTSHLFPKAAIVENADNPILKGKIRDNEGEIVSAADIYIIDALKFDFNILSTNENGEFSVELKKNTDYVVRVLKEGYFMNESAINTKGDNSNHHFNLIFYLEKSKEVVVENADELIPIEEQVLILNKEVAEKELNKELVEEKQLSDELAIVDIEKDTIQEVSSIDRIASDTSVTVQEAVEAVDEAVEQQYKESLKKGYRMMASKNYQEAKKHFTIASEFKPLALTPKRKLKEIALLIEEKEVEQNEIVSKEELLAQQYTSFKSKGDSAYASGNLEYARSQYLQANALFIDSAEVLTKLQDVESQLKTYEQQEKENRFQEYVNLGAAKFHEGNFIGSKTAYRKALEIKKDEDVLQKLKDVESFIQAEEMANAEKNPVITEDLANQEKYNELITSAEVAYQKEDWDLAERYFNEAKLIFADSTFPTERLDSINLHRIAIKENQEKAIKAQKEKEYNQRLQKAVAQFEKGEYEQSGDLFRGLMNDFPEKLEPQKYLNDIDEAKLLLAQKEEEDQSQKVIFERYLKDAETFRLEKNFDLAKDKYNQAQSIFPENENLIAQLALLEKEEQEYQQQMSLLQAKKQKIHLLLEEAKLSYSNNKLNDAKEKYLEVLDLEPDHVNAKSSISKIDSELYAIAQKEEEKAQLNIKYQNVVAQGDKHFEEQQYEQALKSYQEAQKIKDDPQLKNQIDIVEQKIQRNKYLEKQQKLFDSKYSMAEELYGKEELDKAKIELDSALVYEVSDKSKADILLQKIDKRQQELLAEKLDEEQKLAEYQNAILQGDKFLLEAKYDDAIFAFNKALVIKENDEQAIEGVEKARSAKRKKLEFEQKQKEFNALVSRANELHVQNKFEDAKKELLRAQAIMPQDNGVKEKLKTLEADQLAFEKAKKEKDLKKQQYLAAISNAENFANNHEYGKARTEYAKANNLKPSNTEVPQALLELDKQEKAYAQEQKRISKVLAFNKEGDALKEKKEYESAKLKYKEVLTLDEANEHAQKNLLYVDEQIQAIAEAKKLEDLKKLKYQKELVKADGFFANNQLDSAFSAFNRASNLMPDLPYPKDRLKEVDAKMKFLANAENELKNKRLKYKDFMDSGNSAYSKKDFELAKSNYENALSLFPSDLEAKKGINKSDAELNQIAAEKERKRQQELEIQRHVGDGDIAFEKGDYNNAISFYKQAQEIDPSNQESALGIKRASEMIAKEKQHASMLANYKNAIANADLLLKSNKLNEAKAKYQKALEINPKGDDARLGIEKVDGLLLEIAEKKRREDELNTKYLAAIREGDRLLESNELVKAKLSYNEALRLKPNEAVPSKQLKVIEAKEKEQLAAKQETLKKSQYNGLLQEGDELLSNKKYEDAKLKFKEANQLYPEELKPQYKIKSIDKLIAERDKPNNAVVVTNNSTNAENDSPDVEEKTIQIRKTEHNIVIADGQTVIRTKSNIETQNEVVIKNTNPQNIDQIIAEQERKDQELMERERQYSSFLQKGNEQLASKNYDQAITSYENALKIKPENQQIKDQIDKIRNFVVKKNNLTANSTVFVEEESTVTKDHQIKDVNVAINKNTSLVVDEIKDNPALNLKVVDRSSNQALKAAFVYIKAIGGETKKMVTLAQGTLKTDLKNETDYELKIQRRGYKELLYKFTTKGKKGGEILEITIKLDAE